MIVKKNHIYLQHNSHIMFNLFKIIVIIQGEKEDGLCFTYKNLITAIKFSELNPIIKKIQAIAN